MAIPDASVICLTRLCAEMSARMSVLAQMPDGPQIKGERRIQGRPDVYRTDKGRVINIFPRKGSQIRALSIDAREYLQLLRDGYLSTSTHWNEIAFEISKESPQLVVELWVLRRGHASTFHFVHDLNMIGALTGSLMADDECLGWWLEYSYKDTR